ncbi:MAG: Spy0128 family protein [Ruminococcus sp.]
MKKGKLTKLMARASTAVILAFMTAISSISVIAVNTENADTGAKSDLVESGAQLTQNKDYYLIGTFNNWAESDSNWKLTNTDGNCYTGTFTLTGSATNYQFKVFNSDGDGKYYSADGHCFNSSNTVATGLSTSTTNNDQIQCIATSGSITLDVKLYCEYSGDSRLEITQSISGSGGVTEITKGNTTDSGVYSANIYIENQTSGTDIISVNGSFYDYYMDEEIKDKGRWRSSLTGYYRSVENGNEAAAREPFECFNKALGAYSLQNSNWKYPLYFGDFNGQSNGYIGRGDSSLQKFEIRPNNSMATSSTVNGSVSALVDTTLDSNGMLTADGVTLPYFNAEWLKENGYGTVINSPFPMRKSQTAKGNDYFEFDSNGGKDNCYFSGYTDKNFTMNYANNSHKVKDALSGFSGEGDGYGFFPFDRSTEHSGNAYDFGFGMRLDIDFTLGENGTIGSGANKENTQFTFSGDDDLWVYLDGVLVLDMGGDHKKSSGLIDFAKKKSYVNNIDTSYKADKVNALNYVADTSVSGYGYSAEFPQLFANTANTTSTYALGTSEFDNDNPNVKHTLTVFYMERGMVESNLSVGFNFVPAKDSLKVTKTVDASGVNPLLADKVENLDSFGYAVKNAPALDGVPTDISNKNYTFNDSSDGHSYYAVTSGNSFSLANGDSAVFSEQFIPSSYIQVTENDSPKDTVVTLNQDRLLFFDPSGCTWFGDSGAVPAIAQDYDGTTPSNYSLMSSYEVDGKTYYYYPISDTTTTFTIARKTTNGIYNRFKFDVLADDNGELTSNYIKAGSVWNGDTEGQNTCPTYSSATAKGTTYTEFTHTYPDTTQSVIKTSNRSKIAYSPSWSLYDISTSNETSQSNLVDSGTGEESSLFQYINKAYDEMLSTHMLLSYVNTVYTNNITVSKTVVDKDENELSDDNTEFTVKLLVDLNDDDIYEDYGLTGKISQSNPYVFRGIPQGVDYQIVEEDSYGYTNKTGVIEGTLGKESPRHTFTNLLEQTEYTPVVTKTLDGENYYGEKFTFTLEGMESIGLGDDETLDTTGMGSQTVTKIPSDDPGNVVFESITYDEEGTYLYKITEGNVNDTDYQTDSDTIILKVVVRRNNDNTLSLTHTYYKGNLNDYIDDSENGDFVTFDYESFMVDDNATGTPTFENVSTPGAITVLKVDKINDDGTVPDDAIRLQGAEFSLYKVTGDNVTPGANDSPIQTLTTDENGEITFSDLDIFTENGNGLSGAKNYQWYYVVETAAAEGYTLSTNQEWFCFDGATYDDTNNIYTHSFAALNVQIAVPYTGIDYLMQNNFLLYGGLVLGVGTVLACAYMLRKKKARAKAPVGKHGIK